MSAVVYILIGWLLCVMTAVALGGLVLRGLGLRLEGWEGLLYRFLLGAAALSLIVFSLAAAGWIYKGTIYGVAIVSLVFGWRFLPRLPRVEWDWTILAWGPLTLLYLTHAMAPEHSPDGMSYHLGLVARYTREHGFVWLGTNMYAYLSQGLEMLFLFAFVIGRHSAAALVHFTFLLALPALMAVTGGRLGWWAGLFVYALPVVGIDGISAYNDVALAVLVLAVWHAMQRGWVSVAAMLAGFAFAIKFTGGVALLLLLPAWRAWPSWAWALLSILPWLVKNWWWAGNPLAPFFNSVFENPLFNAEFENNYRSFLRHYDLSGFAEWVREIFLGGTRLSGTLGPLALLLPLAYLGWRRQRAALLAATLMLAVYPLNVGTRFLIPALPFLALALFQTFPRLVQPLPYLAALLAWPSVIPLYASPYAWRLEQMPWKAALRIESEEGFLIRKSAGYITARTIEVFVPAGETVFALSPIPESYTSRNVIVAYQSTLGLRLQHALSTPLYEGDQSRFLYECPSGVLKIAKDGHDTWSITEIEPRPTRLQCSRHPWDTGLAMDANAATRWRTWGAVKRGDQCNVLPEQAYKVWGSADQWEVELEGCTRKLETLVTDYRAAAREYFLREKVRYLAVDAPDYPAADMRENPDQWGLELVAERGTMRIYRWR